LPVKKLIADGRSPTERLQPWLIAGLSIVLLSMAAISTWMVVALSDYVIRPRLVGDEALPALLMFIALFGGLEVLGLSGLIVGPVVVSLSAAVLRLYAQEEKTRRRRESGTRV